MRYLKTQLFFSIEETQPRTSQPRWLAFRMNHGAWIRTLPCSGQGHGTVKFSRQRSQLEWKAITFFAGALKGALWSGRSVMVSKCFVYHFFFLSTKVGSLVLSDSYSEILAHISTCLDRSAFFFKQTSTTSRRSFQVLRWNLDILLTASWCHNNRVGCRKIFSRIRTDSPI